MGSKIKESTLQGIMIAPKCFCFSNYTEAYEAKNGAFETGNASIPLFSSANATEAF